MRSLRRNIEQSYDYIDLRIVRNRCRLIKSGKILSILNLGEQPTGRSCIMHYWREENLDESTRRDD